MSQGFTESVVESAALAWLEGLDRMVKHDPEIALGEVGAEHADFGQVILVQRLQDALGRLNLQVPAEGFDNAFPKLTHPERPTLEAHTRPMHQGVFST